MRRAVHIAGFVSLATMAIACAAIIGFEPGIPREIEAGSDAGDAGIEFADIADPNTWSTFDVQSVTGMLPNNFAGGTFDGRYLYLAPIGMSDAIVRYDTTGVFGLATSWDKFGVSALNMNARGYYGATMVNGRVFFTPYTSGLSAFYDTKKPFDAGFALVQTGNPGYIGSVFDGRYLYLVPHYSTANMAYQGLALRYAPDGGGAPDASPWTSFDIPSKLGMMNAAGFWGGVFDGRYVYYAPSISPFVVRYDTTLAFGDVMAWKSFDVRMLRPDAINYMTAAFDGRYVYLVPRGNPNPHGLLVRFDTQMAGAFDKPSAWSVFDTTQVNPTAKGFGGAAFDGRFLYLAPVTSGLVVRFDTTQTFGTSAGWSSFDVATKTSTAKGFLGIVFDGRNLYFVPAASTTVAKFEARTATVPLPYNGGSFF